MTAAGVRAPTRAVALLLVLVGAAVGCAAEAPVPPAAAQLAEPAVAPLAVTEVAAGIWVHEGQIGDFSPSNGGDLANVGFVIGARCVAVIDTGGSARVGASLLGAIRQRTTMPVCYVIATHMHPDHLLGHGAFTALHPEFLAAAHQRAALAARADGYLRRQHDSLGALADGSIVVPPDHPVDGRELLDLGGRQLELRSWHTAHTDNDLTVQDLATATLFTGDLLFRGHLPVLDGSLRGWLQVLPEVQKLATAVVVPGHGPVASARDSGDAFVRELTYLRGLSVEVHAALKRNATLAETVAHTVPPSGWALVDLYHRRNVTSAFAELEWED